MNELVERLSQGKHPVASARTKNVEEFKEMLDRKYVLIKYTGTRGGTELGFHIDEENSRLDNADFENAKGSVHLEGELTLNYERVRCIADINLKTLKGKGYLVPIETVSPSTKVA